MDIEFFGQMQQLVKALQGYPVHVEPTGLHLGHCGFLVGFKVDAAAELRFGAEPDDGLRHPHSRHPVLEHLDPRDRDCLTKDLAELARLCLPTPQSHPDTMSYIEALDLRGRLLEQAFNMEDPAHETHRGFEPSSS